MHWPCRLHRTAVAFAFSRTRRRPPLPLCGSTKRQGASQIYHRLLHPYLDKYEGNIDNGLEEMRAGASRRLHSLGASAASEIAKAVSRQGSSAVGPSYTKAVGRVGDARKAHRHCRPLLPGLLWLRLWLCMLRRPTSNVRLW